MSKTENIDRSWAKEFDAYTEMIVSHPNYSGLFYERGKDGKIKWVVTGKSEKGQLRQQWWDNVCHKLNIPIVKGCYAIAARKIHPTGFHVCQCCGRRMSIKYEYPNKNLAKKLSRAFGLNLKTSDYTIGEFIRIYCNNQDSIDIVASMFGFEAGLSKKGLTDKIYIDFVDTCSKPLSPGVMSNSPDRFDGFHSDGICCREETDKGRHSENMHTYTQDRRAYEEWADGDYNLANRLMGEFQKAKECVCPICGKTRKMSADHIGPISLGFCHSTNFAAMCQPCNSSKNNRFTKHDVEKLLELENAGEQVASWHSMAIWNLLKNKIQNDDDAKKASFIMATAHQNILKIFSLIYETSGKKFLSRYLHPEYSLVDYRFENFDPLDLDKMVIISKPLTSKNKLKNQERYERIAFESLEDFSKKGNRRTTSYYELFSDDLDVVVKYAQEGRFNDADRNLQLLIEELSRYIYKNEWEQ